MQPHLFDPESYQFRALFLSGDLASYRLACAMAESLEHPILALFQAWERQVMYSWSTHNDEERKAEEFYQWVRTARTRRWSFQDRGKVGFPRYFQLFHQTPIYSVEMEGAAFDLNSHREEVASIFELRLEWAWHIASESIEFDPRDLPFLVGSLGLRFHKNLVIRNRLELFSSDLSQLMIRAQGLEMPPSLRTLHRLWALELDVSQTLDTRILGDYCQHLPNLRRLVLRIPNLLDPAHRLHALERLEHLDIRDHSTLSHENFPALSGYLLVLKMRGFIVLERLPKTVREQSFLEHLSIEDCPALCELPRRADFPMLQRLNLRSIGLSPDEHREALKAEFPDAKVEWWS